MKKILDNLAALLKVKSLFTIAVMVVFVILALTGAISADNAMIIISMVVSFYFGTQHESKKTVSVPEAAHTEPVAFELYQATPVEAAVDNSTYNHTHPDSK